MPVPQYPARRGLGNNLRHHWESHVSWSFDETSGRLTISGSGGCEAFESPEDQPWAALRTEIREVWFYDQADLTIENLTYWFTDCVSLTWQRLPYTTSIIGEAAFAGCPSLARILLYYNDEQDFLHCARRILHRHRCGNRDLLSGAV